MSYVEPCCADKQLPKLLRENANKIVTFQTSGDVTVEKLLGAIGWLAGQTHELVLMMPDVDIKLLRHLCWMVRRGWTTKATLLLNDLCSMSDQEITAELIETGGKVFVGFDKMVVGGLLMVTGKDGTVIIQGDMLTEVKAGLRLYAAYWGNSEEKIKMMSAAVKSRLKKVYK